MKLIIRPEQSVLIDKDDIEKVKDLKWYISNAGYAMNREIGLMHRLIMSPPEGKVVDHINGNTLDNRKCNLRVVDQAENVWNSKKTWGASKYRGVWFQKDKGKWCARITCRGVTTHLGYYMTEDEAGKAYLDAAQRRAAS